MTLFGCLLMTVDIARKDFKEFDITDGTNYRRRKTDTIQSDVTQPLDYATEELVEECIESQQWPSSSPKST